MGRQRQHLLLRLRPRQLPRQRQLPRHGNGNHHTETNAIAKAHLVPTASPNSSAAPVTGDDGLVERVVLNALVNITAASPSDICAFGDYLSSS